MGEIIPMKEQRLQTRLDVEIQKQLKRFRLDVKLQTDGGCLGILGPSGCGKSMTLKSIAGIVTPDEGLISIQKGTEQRILFDKSQKVNIKPQKRRIGYLFQNYALYPHMTVFDNMAFGLKLRKVPKEEIEQKVLEAAKILDLEQLLDRRPKALSGGQRQRVAMGRAIVRNPKVFLMDEPLSNLDAKLRVQMRAEIASLHQRLGATIIYVTHDQTEAMTLGTRIVVLKDGVIQQVDTPKKLYNEPQNLFVAGFIGSPQMNFIDAVCKVHGEEVRLEFGDFSIVLPPQKAKKLIDGGYADKTVVMGIRPDDIDDSQIQIETYGDTVIEADVTGYELLGSEVLLYYTVAGVNMTARVDARTTAKIGDHIRLALDPEKIHVFDKESELTITN